jgi:AAA ATPase domain
LIVSCGTADALHGVSGTQVLRAVDRADVQLGPAARLLDAAAGWSPDGPAPALQFEMFDAVARVLAALSTRTPVVVVLDDLQWADDPSLGLLSFLRAQLATERVLLLGAYRDTEVVALPGLGTARVHRLDGLGVEAAAALVRRSGGPQAPVERVEEIRRRCGGNPFFIREMCRLRGARGSPTEFVTSCGSGWGSSRKRAPRCSRPCRWWAGA